MRIVDNEMPYIIFTDKEFRVIHGLAVVYLWLIDLDAIFCGALGAHGADPALVEEYRAFVRTVHRENPLTIRGKKMDARELSAHIHEKLQYEDYLDLFEDVYRWFEQDIGRKLRPARRSGLRPDRPAAPAPTQPSFGRSCSAFRMASSGYS